MSTIDWQSHPSLVPRARLQTDPLTGEPVMLYPEGILALNATAYEIVSHCNGGATVQDIADALAAEYQVNREELASDVLECLEELQRRGLVVFA